MKNKFILLSVGFTMLGIITIAFALALVKTNNLNFYHIMYIIISVTILISSLIICLMLIRLFVKEYKMVYSSKNSFKLLKKRDISNYTKNIETGDEKNNENSILEIQRKWREKKDNSSLLSAKDSFKSDLEINDFDLDKMR